MRWCYQIGRSFRYNLVSGQLINHLSHPVFFTKSPQRSTWQSWPQLLTSHSCWHSSYSWRFCKNHAGQKSVPIWCWNFPWSKKHRKNPGDFHLRAPLGFCQYTLRSSISGSSVSSQPWSKNWRTHDIENTNWTPIWWYLQSWICKGNRANRNRNDKQGCIWLNLLAASLYHCPILLPCDVLSQWPYRKHRASDCTSWRRVDHLPMSWRPQVVEKTTSNLGEMKFWTRHGKKKIQRPRKGQLFGIQQNLWEKTLGYLLLWITSSNCITILDESVLSGVHDIWQREARKPVSEHCFSHTEEWQSNASWSTSTWKKHIYKKLGQKFVALSLGRKTYHIPPMEKQKISSFQPPCRGYMFPIQASYP